MSVFNLLLHGKWNYTKLNLHVYLTLEAVRAVGPGGEMEGGGVKNAFQYVFDRYINTKPIRRGGQIQHFYHYLHPPIFQTFRRYWEGWSPAAAGLKEGATSSFTQYLPCAYYYYAALRKGICDSIRKAGKHTYQLRSSLKAFQLYLSTILKTWHCWFCPKTMVSLLNTEVN